MLLELFINRDNLGLDALTDKVLASGQKGIYQYTVSNEDADEDF